MKLKRLAIAVALIVLSACIVAAQQSQGSDPEVYKDRLLGFEIPIPEGWTTAAKAEQDAVMQMGVDSLKSDDKKINSIIEQARQKEKLLLLITKKPVGSLGNAALGLSSVRQASAVITPRMLAEAAKSVFLDNPKNKLIRDTAIDTIGGKQFAWFEVDMEVAGQMVRLRYLVAMVREYALAVSMSYFDDKDLNTLQASLRSIKFAK